MSTIQTTIIVRATPEEAWAVLGDLGDVHTWIPGVTTCRLDGNRRICNDGEIEEEITDYDPQSRSYRYHHLKIPLPLKSSSGRLAVTRHDEETMIEWEAEIEWYDPEQERAMTAMLKDVNRQVFESLRRRIEAGVRAPVGDP